MTALLALAAITLCGAAITSLFACRGLFRVAMAALMGVGVWSAAYAAVLFAFGAHPVVRLGKDASLVAAATAILWVRRRNATATRSDQRLIREPIPRWMTASVIGGATVATAAFVEHVLRHPDGGWDAWMIWNLRARFLARAGGGFRAAFSPEMLFWVHQDYPLLLPGALAQAFLLVGSEPLWIPITAAFAFALLCVCLLSTSIMELRGSQYAFLAALVLIATPCFIGFAANQQSDVPLAAFLVAACAMCARAVESPSVRDFVLAGVAASLAAWTKNEGIVYLSALVAALLLVRWAPSLQRFRAALRFLAGAAPVLALLVGFKLRVAPPNDLLQGRGESLLDAQRWLALASVLSRRLVFFQNWSLWLVAEMVVVLIVARWRAPPPSVRIIGLAVLLALSVTAFVYVLQPHDLIWFVRASADRVLIQVWPSILLATFLWLSTRAPRAA